MIRGGGGNDTITLDERNGVFTTSERTTIKGDVGNDRLTGGRGRESFDGGAGTTRSAPAPSTATTPSPAEHRSADRDRLGRCRFDRRGRTARACRSPAARARRHCDRRRDARHRSARRGRHAQSQRPARTSLARVGLDLARTAGGATVDGAADRLVVNGSPGADAITVSGDGPNAAVAGLGPRSRRRASSRRPTASPWPVAAARTGSTRAARHGGAQGRGGRRRRRRRGHGLGQRGHARGRRRRRHHFGRSRHDALSGEGGNDTAVGAREGHRCARGAGTTPIAGQPATAPTLSTAATATTA